MNGMVYNSLNSASASPAREFFKVRGTEEQMQELSQIPVSGWKERKGGMSGERRIDSI
jgi:hypothetical protein